MISDLQQLSTRTRDLRKFGLVVGGVFLLSGGWCRATSSGPTSVYRPEEPCRAMNKLSIVKEFWSFLRVKKILAHTNRMFSTFARRNLGDWPGLRVGAIHLLAFLTFRQTIPEICRRG
jgi:hypothetical protein